jgi:hypothetical protein
MAGVLDFVVRRGDDVAFVVAFKDESGAALNIAGRVYAAQMRVSSEASTVAATFVCEVTDGAGGEVTVSLQDSVTEMLVPGEYVWDLEEDASGFVSTVLAGVVTVEADVTR